MRILLLSAGGGGGNILRSLKSLFHRDIAVAEKTLAVQGWGAWPACSAKLGLGEADKTSSAAAPAPAPAPAPANSGGQLYTVRPGDTLFRIAAAAGTDWQAVYAANAAVIGTNPGLIYPGQKLRLP